MRNNKSQAFPATKPKIAKTSNIPIGIQANPDQCVQNPITTAEAKDSNLKVRTNRKCRRRESSLKGSMTPIRVRMMPNGPAHRRLAKGVRLQTETRSRRSVEPGCSGSQSQALYDLVRFHNAARSGSSDRSACLRAFLAMMLLANLRTFRSQIAVPWRSL